ncbi:mechanosensitive ion channel family protein [Thermosulfuriphilus sp.]
MDGIKVDLLNLLGKFLDNPWTLAGLYLLGFVLLAKVVDLIIDQILKRLAGRTRFAFDDEILELIHRPIFWTIALLGPIHVLDLFSQDRLGIYLLAGIKTLIALIWWITSLRFINWLTDKKLLYLISHGHIGQDILYLLKNLLRAIAVVIGLLIILSIWKVNLTPFFASAGIAGIALALAAKETLANFFGGISIFVDRTYRIGDYIILDSGERGEVVDIGIRSTKIKTRDDVLITIPNSIMANSKIINESAPVPRFRLRVPVGVAYGTDLDLVEQVLLEVARQHPRVVEEPSPRVRLRSFGESSIDLELLCWVEEPALKGLARHELIKAIDRAFSRAGITIPFPQRDVHLFWGEDPTLRAPVEKSAD